MYILAIGIALCDNTKILRLCYLVYHRRVIRVILYVYFKWQCRRLIAYG